LALDIAKLIPYFSKSIIREQADASLSFPVTRLKLIVDINFIFV
jgi:hypothetical protein